jgi:hypothetical protein
MTMNDDRPERTPESREAIKQGMPTPRRGSPASATAEPAQPRVQSEDHDLNERLSRAIEGGSSLALESTDEAAARNARRRSIADFEPVPDWLPESVLEHIAPRSVVLLTRVWGTLAAVNALRALLFDGDGIARAWPPPARKELELLCGIHDRLHSADWVPGMPRVPDLSQLSRLETEHRRVLDRLSKSWGHVEAFAVVCHDLFFDHRGDRTGWPTEVFQELVLLRDIHDEVYGKLPPDAEPWKSFTQTG